MKETTILKIATPGDWKDYKKIRLEAITGSDGENFIANIIEEQQRNDSQWVEEASNPNMLIALAWKGSEVIGISRAEKQSTGDNIWYAGSSYFKKEFRLPLVAYRLYKFGLLETYNKGAKKILSFVGFENSVQLKLVQKFGFTITGEKTVDNKHFFSLEMDLTDPVVLKNIL